MLHGVDPDALECMLRLVYGGKVDISTENVLPLLATANRFGVTPLIRASAERYLRPGRGGMHGGVGGSKCMV